MGKIEIKFDPDGDLMTIHFCKPYRGQDSTEIASGIVARTNPITHAIECLEIMDLSARQGKLELPMIVKPFDIAAAD